MRIDPEVRGMRPVRSYCPIKAIELKDGLAGIDFDRCAECTNCLRLAECPAERHRPAGTGLAPVGSSITGDVLTIAQDSGISGRGTVRR